MPQARTTWISVGGLASTLDAPSQHPANQSPELYPSVIVTVRWCERFLHAPSAPKVVGRGGQPIPVSMLDDIKKTLWATADKLRANMDAAEYKHLVLGLIFVKYISDTFAARRAELTARLTNPDDESVSYTHLTLPTIYSV